jgi:hypothetical protein
MWFIFAQVWITLVLKKLHKRGRALGWLIGKAGDFGETTNKLEIEMIQHIVKSSNF